MVHKLRGEPTGLVYLCLVFVITVALASALLPAASASELGEDLLAAPGLPELGEGRISLDSIRDFGDVLAAAIATDKGVKIARYQLNGAMAGLKQVRAALGPQIQGSASYSAANYSESGGIVVDELKTTSGTLTWVQQLGPNTDLRAGLSKARLGAEQSVIQQQQAVVNVISNVQSAYHSLVKALQGVKLAEAAVEIAEKKVSITQDKVSMGTATEVDLLKAKTELLQAENNLRQARSGSDLALLGLLQIIGLDHTYLNQADGWARTLISTQDLTPVYWDVPFEEAVDYALKHRLDVQAAAKQVEMAEVDVAAVKDRRDWKISLNGSRMVDEFWLQGSVDTERLLMATVARTETEGETVSLWSGGTGTSDDPWKVSLEFSYKFSDGGAREAELEQMRSRYESAKLQYQALVDSVSLAVFGAREKMLQAWKSYEQAKLMTEQAQATYQQMQQMEALGSIPEIDLMEARMLVQKAENDLIAAGLDYEGRKTELAVAIGVPPETLIQAVGKRNWAFSLSE